MIETLYDKTTHEAKVATLPEIFYAGKQGYAIEHKGQYIPLPNEGQVGQHLRSIGFDKSEISPTLCKIRLENFVSYIGPVAGHRVGIHINEDSGQPYLVTSGPRIIEGKPGAYPFIKEYLGELFGKDSDQMHAAIGWLRQARQNVIAGKRRPIAACILVGPAGCGKSLFIEVARLCLGGRAAAAFAALSGASSFNSEIIGAELLTVDDEIASRDHRARTQFAQGIKRQLFAGSVCVHAKFREPLNMRPVQGIVVAVNDEPEHLQVLPALDESTSDKITLLSCSHASLGGLDDRDEISRRIKSELPAFVHMLDTTDHPDTMRDQRTGIRAFHSRQVLEALALIAPEERLRELLAQCGAVVRAIESLGSWQGTAAELEKALADDDTTRGPSRSLLNFTSACGVFLFRLMQSGRADIRKGMTHGIAKWTIASVNGKSSG
jgi:hypothetical protein